MSEKFKKMKIALRYRLLGMSQVDPGWRPALIAFDFAESFHTGTRKCGKIPEFMHQVQIASFLLTHVRNLSDPIGVIVCALLHDVCEDYDVDFEVISHKFGHQVCDDVRRLTKKHRGKKKSPEVYFSSIAESENASVVKGVDRIMNLSTMIGVFSREKQIAYCKETRDEFLPFLKEARKKHPSQELVYENIKFNLDSQLYMYETMNGVDDEQE